MNYVDYYCYNKCLISCVFGYFYFRLPFSLLIIDPNDPSQVTDKTRKLGLVVCRGTQVSLICPSDEMEEIANPFAEEEEEEEVEGEIEADA